MRIPGHTGVEAAEAAKVVPVRSGDVLAKEGRLPVTNGRIEHQWFRHGLVADWSTIFD